MANRSFIALPRDNDMIVSESIWWFIEGDNRDWEQLRLDIDTLKQMVAKLEATGVQAPAQKAELLKIQEVIEGIAAQPKIKQVNISTMKNMNSKPGFNHSYDA
jgi:hypothetical protein